MTDCTFKGISNFLFFYWRMPRAHLERERCFATCHRCLIQKRNSIGHFTVQAFDLEWGWRWTCCDRDQYLVSMITKWFAFEKQQGLYHNKVTLSLIPVWRLGNQAHHCKMDYSATLSVQLIHQLHDIMNYQENTTQMRGLETRQTLNLTW